MEDKNEINLDEPLLTFRCEATWMQKAAQIKPITWVKATKSFRLRLTASRLPPHGLGINGGGNQEE